MVPRENKNNAYAKFWDLQWCQEKIKTMLTQNFGEQTKSIMVFLKVAYCRLTVGK